MMSSCRYVVWRCRVPVVALRSSRGCNASPVWSQECCMDSWRRVGVSGKLGKMDDAADGGTMSDDGRLGVPLFEVNDERWLTLVCIDVCALQAGHPRPTDREGREPRNVRPEGAFHIIFLPPTPHIHFPHPLSLDLSCFPTFLYICSVLLSISSCTTSPPFIQCLQSQYKNGVTLR